MKKTINSILILACAAILLLSAGCGASGTPASEPTPEPTPEHVHLWRDGVCAACGEVCGHLWQDGVCSICGEVCAHRWLDGVCRICGMTCTHKWKGGVCTVCASRCPHGEWRDGVCSLCGMRCAHQWENGVCSICGTPCAHRWLDGVCRVCGTPCAHRWEDGICSICGYGCEHEWEDGVCRICGVVCPHESHDAQSRLCAVCGMLIPHDYLNGVCTLCGEQPAFITRLKDIPADFGVPAESSGELANYHFPLNEGEIVPGAKGKKTREERSMRDMVVYTPAGYDPEKAYNVVILAPGAGHNAHFWMERANRLNGELGRVKGSELLDRLIERGYIEPMIVVSVEYYLHGAPSEIAGPYEKDLRERVLPFLAANYGTYASFGEDGSFIPAPEHFAFVGASYGAMIGWQMLPTCTDLFSYWSFLSGGFQEREEQALTERINAFVSEERPILWLYAGDGKMTQGWSPYRHRVERLNENCACLEMGRNLSFLAVEKATHNSTTWDTGLYNSLQIFFHSRYDPTQEPAVPPEQEQAP